jgi:hypothetical protein
MAKERRKANEPKALWTCPRCRRQFVHRNQAHSCGQFTVEQLLDGKPTEMVELYERLADLIGRAGEVVVAPTKTRVLFKVRTVFASVAVNKNWLEVLFVLGRRLRHRRIKKAQEEYPGIVHWLRVEQAEDLDDDLAVWLQEAFDHRMRKDRGEESTESARSSPAGVGEISMGRITHKTGKKTRPKTAIKGKRYLCAICRKRSPKPVKTPAPWYCPRCASQARPEPGAGA